MPGKTKKEGELFIYTSVTRISLHQKLVSPSIYVWFENVDVILIQGIIISTESKQAISFFSFNNS